MNVQDFLCHLDILKLFSFGMFSHNQLLVHNHALFCLHYTQQWKEQNNHQITCSWFPAQGIRGHRVLTQPFFCASSLPPPVVPSAEQAPLFQRQGWTVLFGGLLDASRNLFFMDQKGSKLCYPSWGWKLVGAWKATTVVWSTWLARGYLEKTQEVASQLTGKLSLQELSQICHMKIRLQGQKKFWH